HLSDSVSIVDTRIPELAHVARTLLVGDEPRDIVFAGAGKSRAFITTAHRGQNTGHDPQLTTPGVGRADVWVFDAGNLGTTLAGTYTGVGTVLFNMIVNPVSGKVYVANTDAKNEVRFEGHNAFGPTQGAPAGSVRGHLAESDITVIDPASGTVTPRHLNKHL